MSMFGKALAHYESSSQLGKGGRGEVYLAKGRKLGRDVAIKILPEECARDTDRIARLQREAKLPASLNHPNMLFRGQSIGGIGEGTPWDIHPDGKRFLVMKSAGATPAAGAVARPKITVVVNWLEELKQRVPVK